MSYPHARLIASYLRDGDTLARLKDISPSFAHLAEDSEFWWGLTIALFTTEAFPVDLSRGSPLTKTLDRSVQVFFALSAFPSYIRRTDRDDEGRLWHLCTRESNNWESEEDGSDADDDECPSQQPQISISNSSLIFEPLDPWDITWADNSDQSLHHLWSKIVHKVSIHEQNWLVISGPKDLQVIQHHQVPFNGDIGYESSCLVYFREGNLEVFIIQVGDDGTPTLLARRLLTNVISHHTFVSYRFPRVNLFDDVYNEELDEEDVYLGLYHTSDSSVYIVDSPFRAYYLLNDIQAFIHPPRDIIRRRHTNIPHDDRNYVLDILVNDHEVSFVQRFEDGEEVVFYHASRTI